MTARSTDEAKQHFQKAQRSTQLARLYLEPDDEKTSFTINAIGEIALGLEKLASAMRATYEMLEQMDRKLDANRAPAGVPANMRPGRRNRGPGTRPTTTSRDRAADGTALGRRYQL